MKVPQTLLIVVTSVFILASLALISFIGMSQIHKSNNEFEHLIREQNRQTGLATKMRDAARERMMELWRLSLTEEPFARSDSYEDFLGHATKYLQARDEFLATGLSEKEKKLYDELNEATRNSSIYHRKIADQLMYGDAVSVDEMLNQTLPSQKHSLDALNRIIDLQVVENEQAFKKATSEVERTVNLMMALTASTIFIGAILAMFIYRNNLKMRLQLEQSNQELLYSNQSLETRVAERTRQLQQANSKLQLQAHYDALTGLANRALLTEQMMVILAQAKRENNKAALLFMDLDGFKPINDKYGHDIGDQMLRELSKRLQQNIRNTDLAARIGGDEFVVVLANIHEAFHAQTFAKMLNATMREPIDINGLELEVGVSIGISIYPEHATDSDSLIKAADSAMYNAKREGKGKYRMYNKDMLSDQAVIPRDANNHKDC